MINQLCSCCGEITGPANRCEHCGGDPGAAEIMCDECEGHGWVETFNGRTFGISDCIRCAHSGRPGYVEAPYILEHDAHARRAYWMDCPLSEIPLRAPFKELREVIPEWFLEYAAGFDAPPCVACGDVASHFASDEYSPPRENLCSCCWSLYVVGGYPLTDSEKGRRSFAGGRLVPAGLSAGGGA